MWLTVTGHMGMGGMRFNWTQRQVHAGYCGEALHRMTLSARTTSERATCGRRLVEVKALQVGEVHLLAE